MMVWNHHHHPSLGSLNEGWKLDNLDWDALPEQCHEYNSEYWNKILYLDHGF